MRINFDQPIENVLCEMRTLFFLRLHPDRERISDATLLLNLSEFINRFGCDELYCLLSDPLPNHSNELIKLKFELLEFWSKHQLPCPEFLFLDFFHSKTIQDEETTKYYFSLLARFTNTSDAFNDHWTVKRMVKRFRSRTFEMLFALMNSGMLKDEDQEYSELMKYKNGICFYIYKLDLPLNEKIQLVENALNKDHPLGKLFLTKKFFSFFESSDVDQCLLTLRRHLMHLLSSNHYHPPVLKGHTIQDTDGFDSNPLFSV